MHALFYLIYIRFCPRQVDEEPQKLQSKENAKGKYKVKTGINIKKQTTKALLSFFLLGNFQSHSYVNKRRCQLFLDTLIYLFVYLYVCVCCRVQHCTPPKFNMQEKGSECFTVLLKWRVKFKLMMQSLNICNHIYY